MIQDLTKSTFFERFAITNNLSELQLKNLIEYAELIIEWNEKYNLTAKTKVETIFQDLFQDSIKLFDFIDTKNLKNIADIGTGAGIPGIVLKIVDPNIKMILIEVNSKKRLFLEFVIKKLDLKNIELNATDWRTFNRKTNFPIDLFVTKAAFSDLEIIRMFRENGNYKTKSLVYWASSHWVADKKSIEFVKKVFPYKNHNRHSQLILFQKDK